MIDQKLIRRLKKALGKQPLKLAYLYGSAARGQEGKKSDLDIAVLLKPKTKKADYQIASELQSALGPGTPEIDVREINLETEPVFLRNVLKEGKSIYAKSEKERINFEVKAMKKFYDNAYLRNFMSKHLYQIIKEGRYGHRQSYY